jgi:hypothetical protein
MPTKFQLKPGQSKAILTNIAVCVTIFVAARYVVAPHLRREPATGKSVTSAALTSNQETAAVRLANAYTLSHFQYDASKWTPVVTNRDGHIEVTYKLPPDAIGGRPDIIIDGATMTVISATNTQ